MSRVFDRARVVVISSLILIALLSAGCAQLPSIRPPADAQVQLPPYRIGALLSISGFNSAIGTSARNGLTVLADQINAEGGVNGRRLELVVYDTESTPTTASLLAQRLVQQDRVLAVLGPSSTGEALAISRVIEEAGVPNVAIAAGLGLIEPTVAWRFITPSTNLDGARANAAYLKSRGIERIALLHSTNGFGADGKVAWQRVEQEGGIQLIGVESYDDADADMTVQLTRLRARDPQAIVLWGNNPAQAIVARNARAIGLDTPLLYAHAMASRQFLEQAGEAAAGIIAPTNKPTIADILPALDPQKATIDEFSRLYQSAYGRAPDMFAGNAYDALQIVRHALLRGAETPGQLRDEIEQTRGYAGMTGVYTYGPNDHAGLGPEALVMITVDKGAFVPVR
jgi:branched-chain amino acid transport system substrate-binding protein